jgi:hypothetical protein
MRPFSIISSTILTLLISYLWVGNGLSQWQLSPWVNVILSFTFVIIPGGTVALKLYGSRSWTRFFSYGFPISITFIGIIGLIARSLHWTIDVISFVWFSISLVSLIWLFWQQQFNFRSPKWSDVNWLTLISSLITIIVVAIFAFLAVVQFRFFKDILVYNAEVTYFASGMPLDWQEIYFNTGNLISERFFFAYWTLLQALIVHISGIHILQAQYIFSAIIIFCLGLATYNLGRDVGYSQNTSLIIVLLSFTCYALLLEYPYLPGLRLINFAITDKEVAQFVLFPTVIGVIFRLIAEPSRRFFLLFFLILGGIFFTHPIALGLTVVVVGMWMGLSVVSTRKLFPYIQVVLLCVITMAPLIIIRILTKYQHTLDFGTDPRSYGIVLWVSEDKSLYAPMVEATGILTYIILIVAGIIGIIRIKHPLYRLILSISIMVGIGLFPYTSWFYGRLIGTENIWRNVWIIPYGLMVFASFVSVGDFLRKVIRQSKHSILNKKSISTGLMIFVLSISCLIIAHQLSNTFGKSFSSDINTRLHDFDELVAIGAYIESQHNEQVVVMGDDYVTNVLPLMSYNSRTFMFFKKRQMLSLATLEKSDADDRVDRQGEFFSSATPEEQLETLDIYDIAYILYKVDDYSQFIDPLLDDFPDLFEVAIEIDEYRLLRYLPESE